MKNIFHDHVWSWSHPCGHRKDVNETTNTLVAIRTNGRDGLIKIQQNQCALAIGLPDKFCALFLFSIASSAAQGFDFFSNLWHGASLDGINGTRVYKDYFRAIFIFSFFTIHLQVFTNASYLYVLQLRILFNN